jgi:hypothetical protein
MDTSAEDPVVFDIVPPRKNALQGLGFESFGEYRMWCLREGYQDGLRPRQSQQLALHRVTGARAAHDTEERRGLIRKTVAGQVVGRPDAYDWLEGDEAARQALVRLLLYVNRYVDVLSLRKLSRSAYRHRLLIHGLVELAHHHCRWIRPPEAWSTRIASE